METILTLIVVVVIAFIIITINKSNIPVKLKRKFGSMFPKAKNIDWTHHKQIYEVVFFDDEMEKKAKFDVDFNWIETKSMIFRENIPQQVIASAQKKYPECTFSDVSIIENNKGQKHYKLIIAKDGINFLLKINESFDILQSRNLTFDKMTKFKDNNNFI